jgi:hypothetical protein
MLDPRGTVEKEHILSEIRRTAKENGGIPLGIDRFREVTGIRKEDWYGIHWIKWTDAQVEAGFKPNRFGNAPFDDEWLLRQLSAFIIELGRFPTKPELKMKRHKDDTFPNITTLARRLGNKADMIRKVLEFARAHPEFSGLIPVCQLAEQTIPKAEVTADDSSKQVSGIGHVYLLKHDKVYKIGWSIDAARRYKEIRIQMPHKTEEVHVIETDDPPGIEAYWHNRFRDKRLEGEWFALTADDVKAFKRRKFM